MYFDTHVHFDGVRPPESAQEDERIRRAAAAGVTRMVAVGGTDAMNAAARRVARDFPDSVRAAVGLDRSVAGELRSREAIAAAVARVEDLLRQASPQAVAIGEIGLDYHYEADTRDAQLALFEAQLALAVRLSLPVIVHSREATADTLRVLERHRERWRGAPDAVGVLHCYTGDEAFARALIPLGFLISFSGIVTFRNADLLRGVAAALPERSLLLETDTPYLAPVPHRGKRNEPAFVVEVAACVARQRGIGAEALAAATTVNAQRLFGRWGGAAATQ